MNHLDNHILYFFCKNILFAGYQFKIILVKAVLQSLILLIRKDFAYFNFPNIDRYQVQTKIFNNGFDLLLGGHGGHIFNKSLHGLFIRISGFMATIKNFSTFHKLSELPFKPGVLLT